VTTLATLLAGVRRIDFHAGYTDHSALVFQEGTKLPKGPTVQRVTVVFFSPYPRANTFEILNGYSSICACGRRYYTFGNYMVTVFREVRFAFGPFLEKSLGGLRAFTLELYPQRFVAVSYFVQGFTAVNRTVAIIGYTGNPEIDADHVHDNPFLHVREIDSDVQEKLPIPIDQIRLTFGEPQHFRLSLPASVGD